MILAGFGVNPINRGISPITNRPISHYVSDTVKSDPDLKVADSQHVVCCKQLNYG